MKRACKCGAVHDWEKLPRLGFVGAASEDESMVVELKNCPACKSTMGEEVKRP
jgi:hypothetical protein